MISLTDNLAQDRQLVGAKAASLSRIHSLGFCIPPGFIFEKSYSESLVARAGLQKRIQWLQEEGPLLKETYVLELGADIFQRLQETSLPSEFAQDLERCFDRLGGGSTALICRSSGLMEDSENGAFPGIFLSEPGLTSSAALQKAAMNCVCSLFQPKALRYWLRLQGSQAKFSMGLIVQHFVNTTGAGVMFYWNPEAILIEGIRGSGQGLMSGQKRPVCYRKNKDIRGTWEVTGGETEREDFLGTEQLQELARIGELASKEWKGPVDVEFGFHGKSSSPYIFQCRPVTRELSERVGKLADFPCISSSQGVSCAPGIVRGLAVDPDRGGLVPGDSSKTIALLEVLTERNYDLIFDVNGIVTEQVGSQLNHLSIACRELGIPHVSGIDQARTRFHGRRIFMDGKSGIVSLEADDFPHYEKNATVQPSAFIQANLFYLPYFNHGRWDTQGTQRPIFRGGLYLILEALYHSKTEQDFLGYMIRRMSETFGKEKEAESMIFRLPRLSSEEYSILNQSIEGSGFTQERLERIFQKICEDVKKRLGVTLYLERCPE
ncbi:MAG: PEP-utilizing enzyme [Nitrospirota bacterium]|nr:PEP-utilizing enzyme [Nitrospirota bacterium]MDH4359520.1 PEP-utilizing enzyme [Nitrospirota bacterium]MDH5295741.1 PEP-utilizing enzyme [Nitrospirota bacterium]MDH5574443.1 PEP-utilizing enzyme [Nitrospirota bacterium]